MKTFIDDDPVYKMKGIDLLTVYESIFHSISDAVIYTDTNRCILYINEAAIKQFGYSLEELQGKPTSVIYAEKNDFLDQGNNRFSTDNTPDTSAYRVLYHRKNGLTFTGETHGNHVKDTEGNLLGFVAIIRDITQQEQTKVLATKLGRIVEDSLSEVFLFDENTLHFIEVNRGARENLGYSMKELKGLTPVDIKPEINARQFADILEPLRTGATKLVHFPTVHKRKNGSTYPVDVHVQRVTFGDATMFMANILDITERQAAEDELRRYREHLEELVTSRTIALKDQARIIDQTHDAVISSDLDGNITSWNKGAERLIGFTASEMSGKHFSQIFPAELHQHLQRDVTNPLFAQGSHDLEILMQRKNGSNFYAHLSLSQLRDESGKMKGVAAYAIDISKRRQAELLAQRRSEELERFSYTVSHDLRSPLRAIDGFSLALLEEYSSKLDALGMSYLGRVRNAAQRMGQLIDDLLQLAQINRNVLRRQTVNLSHLVNEVLLLHMENSPTRDTVFTVTPNVTVSGDSGLLRILVDNLIDNAWKYSSLKDQSKITFGIKPSSSETIYFIRDNGTGFDMQYANRLFGPFERLHGSEEFSGTGIGLATVERIVHRHGGRIWAEAEPGKGATFYFTLNPETASPPI